MERSQNRHGQRNVRQSRTDFKSCSCCGQKQHPKDKCPAKDAVCRCCQRKGHFQAYCFTKLEEISAPEEVNLDSALLMMKQIHPR